MVTPALDLIHFPETGWDCFLGFLFDNSWMSWASMMNLWWCLGGMNDLYCRFVSREWMISIVDLLVGNKCSITEDEYNVGIYECGWWDLDWTRRYICNELNTNANEIKQSGSKECLLNDIRKYLWEDEQVSEEEEGSLTQGTQATQ